MKINIENKMPSSSSGSLFSGFKNFEIKLKMIWKTERPPTKLGLERISSEEFIKKQEME